MNMIKIGSDAGSLKRGVVLLRLLATAGSRGLMLSEVAARTAIPHPTVHRILRQLLTELLAEYDSSTRRYRLGPLAFELGVARSASDDIRNLCEPELKALAERSGDTSYLVVRSGLEAVCALRCEGAYPVRALVLEVGSRRPLGMGAGGLAILSAIENDERAEIIKRVTPAIPTAEGLTTQSLQKACEAAQQMRHAVVHNRVTVGVTAVGMPFRDSFGHPVGALSLAALSERMTDAHLRKASTSLWVAVRSVEEKLSRTKLELPRSASM